MYTKGKVVKLPDYLSDCTIFLLAKAYQRAHAEMKRRLADYGLTSVQHLVLSTLWLDGGSTAVALGKQLVLDKATLSGIIDRLSESDWIYKKKDEQDNRVYRLYLTDKAKQLMPNLVELIVQFDADLLADLTTEEKILLKRLLRDLI